MGSHLKDPSSVLLLFSRLYLRMALGSPFPGWILPNRKDGRAGRRWQELRPPYHPWGSAKSCGQEPQPSFTLILPSLAALTPHNDGTQGFRLPRTSWECFHPFGGCQGGPPAFVPCWQQLRPQVTHSPSPMLLAAAPARDGGGKWCNILLLCVPVPASHGPGGGKGAAVRWRCCPSAPPLALGPRVWSGRAEPVPGTPLLL